MMKLNDDYLAFTAKMAHDIKIASYAQLNMQPGSRHLEIGCGNGHDSIALAERFPDSDITGIDLNLDIVQVANQRVSEKGLHNVNHLTGDAAHYMFDGKYHSMRAERVFQHLKDTEIESLVANSAKYAEPGCTFSVVGIDWESLTCTIGKQHLATFRTIKQFLIEVSNITFLHTAIDAFERNGFETGNIDVYNHTTYSFEAALKAFNLEYIASHMAIDAERFEAFRMDFHDGKHFFSVGGSNAPFRYQGSVAPS